MLNPNNEITCSCPHFAKSVPNGSLEEFPRRMKVQAGRWWLGKRRILRFLCLPELSSRVLSMVVRKSVLYFCDLVRP